MRVIEETSLHMRHLRCLWLALKRLHFPVAQPNVIGISLVYTSDYDLYIRNLSESSIFVQSRNLNYNMHQEQTTVCRVPAHSAAICVFSNIVFQQVSSSLDGRHNPVMIFLIPDATKC